ncbi:MAG: hypothetical protein RR900_02460 [Ruthenibacterium sp.]
MAIIKKALMPVDKIAAAIVSLNSFTPNGTPVIVYQNDGFYLLICAANPVIFQPKAKVWDWYQYRRKKAQSYADYESKICTHRIEKNSFKTPYAAIVFCGIFFIRAVF